MINKIFISIIIVIAIFYVFYIYSQAKIEMLSSYNFVIEKIKVFPTSSIEIYSNNRRYQFWNFSLTEFDNIKVGDRLVKNECSTYIAIYRKDSIQVEYLFLKKFANKAIPSYRCKAQ